MRPQKEILEIFDILSANDPAPKSELEYSNAFTLLVAIVLSAQSTDKGVNKATKELFKVADTPAKMAALGVEKLKEYIKTIGLYNNKAKNVIAMSEILVRDYNGEVPEEQEKLESLPGVGHKTANVLRNVWFGKPTMAVDTHGFPHCPPARFQPRQNRRSGGKGSAQSTAGKISDVCQPLAGFVRPLCVQGAKTKMYRMSFGSILPVGR